jgi:tripartite-type tricarboxylate transporter receptor subunit TctC
VVSLKLLYRLALFFVVQFGVLTNSVWADKYFSTKPMRFVSAMAAGGSGDINARRLADALRMRLGNQVVVDNRAGGGGNLAAVIAANANPDGFTLFFASEQIFTVNPTITPKLPFKLEDFRPLILVSKTPHILLVSNASSSHTLSELIQFSKSNPVPLHFGSGGIGTSPHLAGEWFKGLASIKLVHVPYRGASLSLSALMSNEIQLLFDSTLTALGHIHSGRARGLAIASQNRSPLIPELPTFTESGYPKFEVGVTHGLLLPVATPASISDNLNKILNEILIETEYKKKMTDVGAQVVGGSPQYFHDYLVSERKKWAEVIAKQKITF